MNKVIVFCNCDEGKVGTKYKEFDSDISIINIITADTKEKNLKIQIDNITHKILNNLDPKAQDLLEIASYIYYADCSISRGSGKDIFLEKWQRDITFKIPVSDPIFWNNDRIKNLLIENLEYLTDDKFKFDFLPPTPKPTQLIIKFPKKVLLFHKPDCICLFSGGLDSLIGSLYLLKEKGLHPLLVSHRSLPKMDSLQKGLVKNICDKNVEWDFPQISIWINRMGKRAIEPTQRSRSFLYLSIASIIAFQINLKKIFIFENGIVSINLPISAQNLGSLMTRSTHPKFLSLYNELVKEIFSKPFKILNPFIYNTKAQTINKFKKWDQYELIQNTISCSYTQGKTKLQPQCGVCSQCVDRRFSILKNNLEKYDKTEYYEKDIFIDALEGGKETSFPEGYIRTAIEIINMNDNQFYAKYPELYEVIESLNSSGEKCAQRIYDLYQNHSKEIINVLKEQFNKYFNKYLSGELPDNCLISIVGKRDYLVDPMKKYIDNIIKTIKEGVQISYSRKKPQNEEEIQIQVKALLKAAEEKLRRESPMLSYSTVKTKPDFSNIQSFSRSLFVELKHLNKRVKLNKIVTEITSRITIYKDQGAYVLFIIYDNDKFIVDDDEFISDFEKHEGIRAIVIR
jgi:7-cyano-7-deazaguanine synthase in queuosine biosynthesis